VASCLECTPTYPDVAQSSYVIDRVADMIVSGRFNIWPTELERTISAMPGARDVVVFGVPDQKGGETPLAEVILEDGVSLTEDVVIAECADRLGSYKKPGKVVFRADPFPRSPVGKIQRKVIREQY
jgi:acyl-CoA synthetase (AMP-forming)/AMP-acid ligase II